MSHPVWVRGLKHWVVWYCGYIYQSHPVWVRGLKLKTLVSGVTGYMSHPVWVRGLKLSPLCHFLALCDVAPRVGAWIETELKYH